MTEEYKTDTVAIILAEMLKESRNNEITKGEFHKLPQKYADRLVKLFAIPVVSGSYSYEIDFGTHCRAGIDIANNEPKVIGAMNGWGDGISLADIKIKKL